MENLRWLKANGGVEAADKRAHERAEVLYAEIDRNKLFKGTVEEAYPFFDEHLLRDER